MENSKQLFIRTICYNLFILGFLFLVTGCNNTPSKDKSSNTETDAIEKVNEILWNVKAINPEGQSLDIKAFDEEGKSFDIKAIQNSDQDSFLEVKAIIDGGKYPVKMLVSKDKFVPVRAINKDGMAYDLKAVTPEGEKLDVKGVARFGNIIIMKAITKDGDFYGVKAVSPEGQLNDIKGIKINFKDKEMSLKGQSVHAHVMAMHQAVNEDDFIMSEKKTQKKNKKKKKGELYKNDFKRIIWNIKAVTTDGKNLDIKAFDAEGNKFDVKATQDSKQFSFMNIKAFVEEQELPVKVIQSTDEYAPIKAIGIDGTIYDIKAITEDNVQLDVKGISRSGNIIHVKAIDENGELYGVKAFAPDGKLNDVKGIKIFERDVELRIKGNPVHAHLKAIN